MGREKRPSPLDAGPEGIQIEDGTQRKLEARHIQVSFHCTRLICAFQMIAIGGTIGTGLFLNSATVISASGAVGALIAFIVAGVSVFFVCSSLGEMATLIPCSGSFSTFGSRYVEPALGLAIGWYISFLAHLLRVYCILYFIILPIELMSAASFLRYWFPHISQYYFMGGILLVLVIINCLAVKGFGEVEYWLAMIKIAAILFFLAVAIYILCRENPGISSYSKAGGPFLGTGFASAFQNIIRAIVGACFSFGGTEMIGITAGEAKNPRKSVPRAINGTFWRIMFFYVLSILFIGLLIPANADELVTGDQLGRSPYVLALQKAKIPGVVCPTASD